MVDEVNKTIIITSKAANRVLDSFLKTLPKACRVIELLANRNIRISLNARMNLKSISIKEPKKKGKIAIRSITAKGVKIYRNLPLMGWL
jgi:hypothetical protein